VEARAKALALLLLEPADSCGESQLEPLGSGVRLTVAGEEFSFDWPAFVEAWLTAIRADQRAEAELFACLCEWNTGSGQR
jgi:hypothetical protein